VTKVQSRKKVLPDASPVQGRHGGARWGARRRAVLRPRKHAQRHPLFHSGEKSRTRRIPVHADLCGALNDWPELLVSQAASECAPGRVLLLPDEAAQEVEEARINRTRSGARAH